MISGIESEILTWPRFDREKGHVTPSGTLLTAQLLGNLINVKMANPRKFSEKIALHKQRQAEEQASYERVLMEVRAVTQTPVQVF